MNTEDPGPRHKSANVEESYAKPTTISTGWVSRMVARIKKNLSLCERREVFADYSCVYRKFAGIMGFVEFYPEK